MNLSGQEILTILSDFARRGADSDKLQGVYSQLRTLSNGDFTEELAQKVAGIILTKEKVERNLTDEVKRWVKSQDGHFSVTDGHRFLALVTPGHKHAFNVAISRMVGKTIEKYGNRAGVYRKLTESFEVVNFKGTPHQPMKLLWPLDLEKRFLVYPKNIVVLAGETNTGKSTFLQCFAYMNRQKQDIYYFDSDAGEEEVEDAMCIFGTPAKEWGIKVVTDVMGNYQDYVQPNSVNVFDYLELYDNFYAVGQIIKDIADRLDKGIAIVALQKNPKSDKGLGGMFGTFKARVYLNLGWGWLQTWKVKNWKNLGIENPNGKQINFKIGPYGVFIPESDWYEKEEVTSDQKRTKLKDAEQRHWEH